MATVDMSRACSECQTPLPEHSRFCVRCGAPVHTSGISTALPTDEPSPTSTSGQKGSFDRVVDYMTSVGWTVEARDDNSAAFVSPRSGRRVALVLQPDGQLLQTGTPLDFLGALQQQLDHQPDQQQPAVRFWQRPLVEWPWVRLFLACCAVVAALILLANFGTTLGVLVLVGFAASVSVTLIRRSPTSGHRAKHVATDGQQDARRLILKRRGRTIGLVCGVMLAVVAVGWFIWVGMDEQDAQGRFNAAANTWTGSQVENSLDDLSKYSVDAESALKALTLVAPKMEAETSDSNLQSSAYPQNDGTKPNLGTYHDLMVVSAQVSSVKNEDLSTVTTAIVDTAIAYGESYTDTGNYLLNTAEKTHSSVKNVAEDAESIKARVGEQTPDLATTVNLIVAADRAGMRP